MANHPVPPSALASWSDIVHHFEESSAAIFLDYDGTLSPIVSRPEDAILSQQTRAVLRRLASRCPVAIVSGRGRADVRALVGLDALYYIGSHGHDIEGPPGSGIRRTPDPGLETEMNAIADELERRIGDVPGALVERKGFAVSVHHRLVEPSRAVDLERAVDDVVADRPTVRKAYGKKVIEVRPALPWHKGSAVLWLRDILAAQLGRTLVPLVVGDDLTDEDMFASVAGEGVTVVVADSSELEWQTRAGYSLRDTGEVRRLLERVLELAERP